MGWFDGFPFKSKQQREKERREFERLVFPFGVEEQRAAARKVLNEMLPGKKIQDEQRLYAFICAKEAYLTCEEAGEEVDAALRTMRKQPWITDEFAASILSLIRLEKNIESLEEYPTAEEVQAAAPTIEKT